MKLLSAIIGSAIAILLIIAFYIYLLKNYVSPEWGVTGVFGDSFGALTAFSSAMAFAGVLYSISQQNKVLEKQEIEIADNKRLTKQQAETIVLQRFDGAFYNMFAIFNSIKASNYTHEKFDTYYINNLGPNSHIRKISESLAALKKVYTETGVYGFVLRDECIKNFAQYLSSFESMVDLIVEESPQKEKHLKYFFGQLTDLEKIILLYHFHLGSTPRHFNQLKGPLFKSLREFPNQVYTPHSIFFEGMKD